MAATQSLKVQDEKLSSLGLLKTVVNKEQVCCYSRGLGNASKKNPVLVLIHGYPQSAYEWRHIIPLFPKDAPIFAPDLPGYGASAAIENNDKLTVGNTIMAALETELKRTSSGSSSSDTPIVLIGHDRGGRIAHRLAVSGYEGLTILGVCIIDIVPTSTQWHHATSPSRTAKKITGYFHWAFLANVDLATRMITAYGGDNWCTDMINSWAGANESGLASLKSDDALAVYGGFLSQPHVITATCEDYKHGMSTDIEAQERDQAEGRKIKAPLLLLYSKDFTAPVSKKGLKDELVFSAIRKALSADGNKDHDAADGLEISPLGEPSSRKSRHSRRSAKNKEKTSVGVGVGLGNEDVSQVPEVGKKEHRRSRHHRPSRHEILVVKTNKDGSSSENENEGTFELSEKTHKTKQKHRSSHRHSQRPGKSPVSAPQNTDPIPDFLL